MEQIILEDIPFRINPDRLFHELRVRKDSSYAQDLLRLAEEAQAIGKPKALYGMVPVESKNEKSVTIDGTEVTSQVLRVNLDQAHKVFPFVATCGTELEEWSNAIEDMLHNFWADQIKEAALRTAIRFLESHITSSFHLEKTSSMSPGSLPDWPITQQRVLFKILGNPEESIGVRLTDSMLMIPTKSVSGITFPTQVSFASCMLCPMERCPSRRAPYDPDLYDQKYRN